MLLLVAAGYSGPEIAKILQLSPWTVQAHQRRIRAKLGTRTLAHSVAVAIARSELDLDLIR